MTILQVVQGAATVLGIDVPTLVYGSTQRELVEMQVLANEMARRIADVNDWQVLKTIKQYDGDGVTGDPVGFALPDDYDRMLVTASVWSSQWTWNLNHITDSDQWLEMQVVPFTFIYGNWMIYGGAYHQLPIMPVGSNVKFFYISNLIVRASDNSTKTEFSADDDTFRLDEHLLKLGIIWQWKASKGYPYAEDMTNYERRLAQVLNQDTGSKPIVSGRPRFNWWWPGSVRGVV
ncbi:hypothetical protein FJV76_14280 [Mesorhizobium sp. WSM4303]|uniref:hypothetical protein n=1 Tax=Mesorhizobium sp. WSM4303 TaxID=2589887 RepID=UPI00115CF9F4|nr:hypothetical protein [Mesorhizobium sp. WSM4303]TRD03801.1 hypothetical protein FJV76_14280 [Mesorhizobium sp. WSM4303]